jgi:WD40 repeat protein
LHDQIEPSSSHNPIGCLGIRPDGNIIAAATDLAVLIYEFKDGKLQLRGSVSRIGSAFNAYKYCTFVRDHRLILVTSSCIVSVYDENGQREFSRARFKNKGNWLAGGSVVAAAASPSGREIVVANEGVLPSVRVLALPDLHEIAKVPPQKVGPLGYMSNKDQRSAVQISGDGRRFVLGDKDGGIRIFDLQNCQELVFLRSADNVRRKINDLSFSPDGKLLASASNDGTARVWTV